MPLDLACIMCHRFIEGEMLPGPVCLDCRGFGSEGEAVHPLLFRCPSCRGVSNLIPRFGEGVLEEGAHLVACPRCSHPFTIETAVDYRFTSPALEPQHAEAR